jgi:hypothetical protein
MKYRIAGYGGAHDEAGARIVDEHGNYVLTTPSLKANAPEHWKTYYDTNILVLNALNGYQPMLDALKLVDGVIHSAIPENGDAHDKACQAVRSAMALAEGLMWVARLVEGEWCVVDVFSGEAQACDSMATAKAEAENLNAIYRHNRR